MYDWKTLRNLGLVLLCLPLVHLAYLGVQMRQTLANPDPAVWQDQLQDIIDGDQGASLPAAPIVATGGLSVRLWKDLPDAVAERPTLLRPLGGASIEDLTHHYNRLIGYYRPSVLIVMPSYEELHLRKKKNTESLVTALRALLERNLALAVTSRRYVVMPVKTLLHPDDGPRIDAMTAAARNLVRSMPLTTVLDPNPLLAGRDGRPNPDYFALDGINLNEGGYAQLSALVRRTLVEDRMISGAI